MTCPRCNSLEHTEQLDDSRWWWCDAPTCRFVFTPEQPPRLIDPEPRRRKDTDT